MFFVSGITGQVGGAAARRLLEEGHTVRTLAATRKGPLNGHRKA